MMLPTNCHKCGQPINWKGIDMSAIPNPELAVCERCQTLVTCKEGHAALVIVHRYEGRRQVAWVPR